MRHYIRSDAPARRVFLLLWSARIVSDTPGDLWNQGETHALNLDQMLEDTGSGMTPEVGEHIFEPFFTTKEKGAAMGLGLVTGYRIVNERGGGIGVDTEPGHGTTFRIYWPHLEET